MLGYNYDESEEVDSREYREKCHEAREVLLKIVENACAAFGRQWYQVDAAYIDEARELLEK